MNKPVEIAQLELNNLDLDDQLARLQGVLREDVDLGSLEEVGCGDRAAARSAGAAGSSCQANPSTEVTIAFGFEPS